MALVKRLLKWSGIAALGMIVVLVGLVAYAAASGGDRLVFADAPSPALVASSDPALIAEGSYLVHGPAHCAQCHSATDRNHPELINGTPLHGGLEFAMGPLGTRYSRNLTPDVTGIGNLTDAQLARAIRTGVTHEGELSLLMYFSAARLSDHDVIAVMSYLRSLQPVSNVVPAGSWALFGKVLITYVFPTMEPLSLEGPTHVAASAEPTLERGRYLTESVMMCQACHTAFNMQTFAPEGPPLGGGLPEPSHGDDHDMEFVAPNLTNHPTGITGQLSEDAFVARLRGGRVHMSSIMPWENFANATESDLRSVYRFIQSLPPVENDVGPTYREIGWTPPAQ